MKLTNLNPCPDCGSPPEIRYCANEDEARIMVVVGCSNRDCNKEDKEHGAYCTDQYKTEEEAIEAWQKGEHYKIKYFSFAGGRWMGD